eukprot:g959.t1
MSSLVFPPVAYPLLCQKDSYVKNASVKVTHCEADPDHAETWKVYTDDTIAFPGGGGQPVDHVQLKKDKNDDSYHCTRVERTDDGELFHVVESKEKPFMSEEPVELSLDWKRRFDHMCQHSGQHLITAVALRKYSRETLSWSLGEKTSYLDLAGKFTEEQIRELEKDVNSHILAGLEVTARLDNEDGVEATRKSRKIAMAKGFESQALRIVSIAGLDSNTCCGTHVKNLGHLQNCVLFRTEIVKGNTRVHFVMGDRVPKLLNLMFSRSLALNSLLSCGSDQHSEAVTNMQKSNHGMKKEIKNLMQDLAVSKANAVDLSSGIICDYYPQGNNDYLKHFITTLETRCGVSSKKKKKKKKNQGKQEEIKTDCSTQEGKSALESFPTKIFYCVGKENEDGYFLLGGSSLEQDMQKKIMEILGGRGGGRSYISGKFKVSGKKIEEVKKFIGF